MSIFAKNQNQFEHSGYSHSDLFWKILKNQGKMNSGHGNRRNDNFDFQLNFRGLS